MSVEIYKPPNDARNLGQIERAVKRMDGGMIDAGGNGESPKN